MTGARDARGRALPGAEMERRLDDLAISPNGFVFDTRSGATFSLNPTAIQLIEGLREGLGLAGMVERLRNAFDAKGADLQRDVLEYVRALKVEGLLDSDFELQE